MPVESSRDPRELLVRRKYFTVRPQPLEQWLWRQAIAPSAERVFWLHWQEGMRNRDWCSSIPLKRVAALCALDVSSVTRAYQTLARLGLVRRQDPGRDPGRPFEQAVAITEVRLPHELLTELTRYPDRTCAPAPPRVTPTIAPPALVASPEAPATTDQPALHSDPLKGLSGLERHRLLGALLHRLSANERRQFDEALRARRSQLIFENASQLSATEQTTLQQILHIAASQATVPSTTAGENSAAKSPRETTRKLTAFELARLRRDVRAITDAQRAAELLREVVWAVEQGALRRFALLHAVRIALKKIREGLWTRPHRMPPSWSRELTSIHPTGKAAHIQLCETA
jgi:hypothetical protein